LKLAKSKPKAKGSWILDSGNIESKKRKGGQEPGARSQKAGSQAKIPKRLGGFLETGPEPKLHSTHQGRINHSKSRLLYLTRQKKTATVKLRYGSLS